MATTLLSEIKIGGQVLKNRVFMAPLTRARAGPSQVPNELMKDYYTQRASAGLIISEATAISAQGYGWYGAASLYTQEHADAWKDVVDSVHSKGGKMYLQLWHLGRQGHGSFNPLNEVVSASDGEGISGHTRTADFERVPYTPYRGLTLEEIPKVIEDYKKSAELAKYAGFDGVEVHAANGYLLDQFLQSSINKRTDQYGGTMENRARLLLEVIEAVKEIYPINRIAVRISPNGAFGDSGSDDNDVMFPYVAEQLNKYDLAYLHVMDGVGFGFHNKCRVVTLFDIKKKFDKPIVGNVGYTKDTAEGAIRTGSVDAIAFGRPFISNPDLVERFTNDWPLAPEAPHEVWFHPGPELESRKKGYADYPFYEAK